MYREGNRLARVVTLDEMSKYINKNFDNSLQLLTESSLQSYLPFTFVSYSSKDSKYLPYVLKILVNHGANPYIDKGDERLPNPPSIKTAEVLKNTIKKSKKMVVFVTSNSKDSKWIPWELGLGDGMKTKEHIVIFPSAEKSYETEWIEQEYLGLYKRIVYGKLQNYDNDVWMVYDSKSNIGIELSRWLSN